VSLLTVYSWIEQSSYITKFKDIKTRQTGVVVVVCLFVLGHFFRFLFAFIASLKCYFFKITLSGKDFRIVFCPIACAKKSGGRK